MSEKMKCELCEAIHESYRHIYQDEWSFCVVCQRPLKEGHILILPKRHVTEYSKLSSLESKSLFNLMNRFERILKMIYGEDVVIHINRGKHSSQDHVHIHMLPSKGNLRDLISFYEGVSRFEHKHADFMKNIRNKICKVMK